MKTSINKTDKSCLLCRNQVSPARDAGPGCDQAIPLLEIHGAEIYVDSAVVARKFGMDHDLLGLVVRHVLDGIYSASSDPCHPDQPASDWSGARYLIFEREHRGKPYTAILMNRQLFTLVASRCLSRGALAWHDRFLDGFHQIERRLIAQHDNQASISWQDPRKLGIKMRHALEDSISSFVSYAKAHGSVHADQYFTHITKVIYRLLGLRVAKGQNVRDGLSQLELMSLATAELFAAQRLTELIQATVPYKEIFAQLVVDLFQYCSPLPPPHSSNGNPNQSEVKASTCTLVRR